MSVCVCACVCMCKEDDGGEKNRATTFVQVRPVSRFTTQLLRLILHAKVRFSYFTEGGSPGGRTIFFLSHCLLLPQYYLKTRQINSEKRKEREIFFSRKTK